MVGRLEMPGRVLILRVVTAAHMSTGETEAQVDPGVTSFQTLFAAVCTRGDLSYLVEMCTLFCHRPFHSFHPEWGVVLISSCYPCKDFPGCSEAVPSMSECCEREANRLLVKSFFYVFNVICYPNSFQYNRGALQTALQRHRKAFPWLARVRHTGAILCMFCPPK